MATEDLTRELRILPAWDLRSEGKGQQFVEMRWYLKGPACVVQFVLYTGWSKDLIGDPAGGIGATYLDRGSPPFRPIPADLGFHSPVPLYEGQDPMGSSCEFFPTCFYEGSTFQAFRIFSILVHQGGDAVWHELEYLYHRKTGTLLRDDDDRTVVTSGDAEIVCYHDWTTDGPSGETCNICGKQRGSS